MDNDLGYIKERFKVHMDTVIRLINFDKFILDYCIGSIETLDNRIRNNPVIEITNPRFFFTSTIQSLKNIREHDSMKIYYQGIYNQCIVLSVSYFTSTLSELFRGAVNYTVQNKPHILSSSSEDFKISLSELHACNYNLTDSLGDIIIKKKDISFQDMQSVARAFKAFFNIEIIKDQNVNDIIIGMASRHAIVHALAIADDKFIKQIIDANPRTIKPDIKFGDKIQFYENEITYLIEQMNLYVSSLLDRVSNL